MYPCLCISEALKAMLKARLRALEGCRFSSKASKTCEFMVGTKESNILPDEGSLIGPPGISIIFQEKKTEKLVLFARPGWQEICGESLQSIALGPALTGVFASPLASGMVGLFTEDGSHSFVPFLKHRFNLNP